MNINLLNEIDVNTLRNAIESADNIVITCHKSPDGDALGSSLAWYDFL
ncbi:MAG: bifunctional oligoribonuclease/PAP phosphatase NrnA, partial [Prevotella nanceiensis]|nr:bifunctional oligoribonuclease/PAP phosphatase NrnA [Hoylesella nanceiensis]